MRWASFNEKWSRPIKNILCILDKEIVNFEFAGLKSNNFIYGNYQYFQNKIKCTDSKSYKLKLKNTLLFLIKKKE